MFRNFFIKLSLVLESIATIADGDGRSALNILELAANVAIANNSSHSNPTISKETVGQVLQKNTIISDKNGEEHYNLISALHKSMRGSNIDASLYWLARMLESGQEPLYVARRLIRFASEDIGIADPMALVQANAAYQAAHSIGMPECNVNLAQCVVYLAKAPKSTSVYEAYEKIKKIVKTEENPPVPLHLRNGVTSLMKDLGYGKDYKYNPMYKDKPHEVANQTYLPQKLVGRKFFDDS